MPWWGWILLGSLLLGSEMLVDSQFYLLFVGSAALLVGLAGLGGVEGEIWEEWLAFALVSVVLLASLRGRLYSSWTEAPGTAPALIGEVAVATQDIGSGQTGAAELRGSPWSARNIGDSPVVAGTRVRVEGTEGLLLLVRSEDE